MHFIDLSQDKILANRRNPSADADVLALSGFLRLLEGRFRAVANEVKRGSALHLQRSTRMMRQHKHRRVIRRSVAPPSFPRIIRPRSAHRPKHVASEDPCAHIVERLRSHVVIDAATPATSTLHLLKDLGLKKPREDLRTTNP